MRIKRCHIKSPLETEKTIKNYSAKSSSSTSIPQLESPFEFIAPLTSAGQRLDQLLAQLLPQWSRNRLQSWILEGHIRVDGNIVSTKQKIWGTEKISVHPHIVSVNEAHTAEAIPLNIIYEDAHILVVDKPAGMVVHPGNGNWQGTLLNALLHHAHQLNDVPRAGIVHRLDKDTSGLLVVAKTIETQISLVRQLQQHTVKRDYLAVVLGEVKQSSYVDAPIGRHPVQRTKMAISSQGKPARTHYQILEPFHGCTLLCCSLETGRTHQIRVHMHSIGHPLVGDPVYTGRPSKTSPFMAQFIMQFPRQALHAQQLSLAHPQHGEIMSWHSDLPDDMDSLLQALRSEQMSSGHGTR